MSNTRPFTEAHAIASVDVALIFRDDLEAEQRSALLAAYRERLVEFEMSQSDDDDDDDDDDDGRIAFTRKDLDGDVIEELHVHGDYAHIIWTDYRGWDFTRDESLNRLQPILEMARQGQIELTSMGLAYRDVFVNESPSTYEPREVFREGSRFLAPMAFSVGNQWKHWISWVSEAKPPIASKIKSGLGIDAKVVKFQDDVAHFTEILHRQQIRGNASRGAGVEWSDETVAARLDLAHLQNKDILFDLLDPGMIQKIGLKEGNL